MKVTALAITSILFILAIAWKMSDGPNDATIYEQTDISALSPATKTDVAKESQSESVFRVTDTNKTTEIDRIVSTSSIETQYPEKEDAPSTELQKVYTELEADVMAIVNAERQNPHLPNEEGIDGIVSVEADIARIIIEAFKEGNLRVLGEDYIDNNAWELSIPSESEMHFEKKWGIDVQKSEGEVLKVTFIYE